MTKLPHNAKNSQQWLPYATMHPRFRKKIPKYRQIAESILEAIKQGKLKKGDLLFSINTVSEECFLSRATVQRAYKLLRKRGIIDAFRGKGYYVKKSLGEEIFRILFVLDTISESKKRLYNAFIQTMGECAIVDWRVHNGNARVLEYMLELSVDKYDFYVVTPLSGTGSDSLQAVFARIPPEQLVVIDREYNESARYSRAVFQDFKRDIVEALEAASDLLDKYDKLNLVYPEYLLYPRDILVGFRSFCNANAFPHSILPRITKDTAITAGEAYVLLDDQDLVELLKICSLQNLIVGKDVGIVSYNDALLKETLMDGITVITTDVEKMGKTVAELLLFNRHEKIKNPFFIIRRNSL